MEMRAPLLVRHKLGIHYFGSLIEHKMASKEEKGFN